MNKLFLFTGITGSRFRLKPTEEIVEEAKKYVSRRTVTVKKAMQKEQPLAAEMSEQESLNCFKQAWKLRGLYLGNRYIYIGLKR